MVTSATKGVSSGAARVTTQDIVFESLKVLRRKLRGTFFIA